ncbi:hypothetical protein GO755_26435 [Spirosoma sp. HMF4905]|uniref:Uncharacterized protein n=1 Tax=Spirosoma arboris TaxID=2682092 RepID=A0A7K1SIQ5_9BACT|nr:hypothetical protein [Spirosoma arboris]MVM33604.1 hypothetical protein [Spirosoma arboris]
MNQTPMYIVFTCISGLAQYGALLLNVDSKSKVWKRGIYVGMIGSAYSAGAFGIPRFELYPCLVFMIAIAVMLSCVVGSYYTAPIPESFTPLQREERIEVKHSALRQLGIGLILSILVATCVGYTQSQSDGNRVQIGFAGVVYRLADEVKSLHGVVSDLVVDVRQLKAENRHRAKADSIAQMRSLRNQEKMLKQNR